MKRLILVAGALASVTFSATAQGQRSSWNMIQVGDRVRVALTAHVLSSPRARTGKLRKVIGTVRAIEPDTIRLETSAADSVIAVARILIDGVERSLGRERAASAGDAALVGLGLGATFMGAFPQNIQFGVAGSGAAVGTLFGLVHPFERWERAWIPE